MFGAPVLLLGFAAILGFFLVLGDDTQVGLCHLVLLRSRLGNILPDSNCLVRFTQFVVGSANIELGLVEVLRSILGNTFPRH